MIKKEIYNKTNHFAHELEKMTIRKCEEVV